MSERIVVIGGNAAGMTAASRAKRLDPGLDIQILELSHFISYSICGLPYYVSGDVASHRQLISFTPERLLRERGIRARLRTRVEEILPGRKKILCRNLEDGQEFEESYDRLVIATGYIPGVPRIEGVEGDRVLTVSRLEDGLRIRHEIEKNRVRHVAIVGAGYIGLMMAHATRKLGLDVTLVERERHVFSQVDEDISKLIEKELRANGVMLLLHETVERIDAEDRVKTDRGEFAAQLVLVDVGVRPNTRLAEKSNIACGLSGGIQVDERGQTSVYGIFAAGNCAETIHLVTKRPICSALGTTAARQGRVVGESLAGLRSSFGGTLETSVEKVFGLAIARTGLTLRQAFQAGLEADAVTISDRDRNAYYPGSRPLTIRLVFEKSGGRLLGGQLAGSELAAKRIDTLVTALTAGMSLSDLSQLDLAYAPPVGTLWDPIQIAANQGLKKL